MRSVFRVLAVLGVACLLLPAAPVSAASGTTSVSITVPPLVILYYYADVDLSITAGDLATVFGLTDTDDAVSTADLGAETYSAAAGSLTVTPATALTTTPPTAATAYVVLSTNWRVRSIGNPGNQTQVAVAVGDSTIDGPSGGSIEISGVQTRVGAGAWGASTAFAPTGLGNTQAGDVRLNLDFTDAAYAEAYATGTYTITATNL